MKFNRVALLRAAEASIDAQRVAHEASEAQRVAEYEQKKADWVATYGDPWRAACKGIVAKLRKGQPIDDADLPQQEHGYRGRAVFHDSAPRPTDFREPRDLRALIGTLSVIADDEVTTSGLGAVGMTRTAISAAVRELRSGEVHA